MMRVLGGGRVHQRADVAVGSGQGGVHLALVLVRVQQRGWWWWWCRVGGGRAPVPQRRPLWWRRGVCFGSRRVRRHRRPRRVGTRILQRSHPRQPGPHKMGRGGRAWRDTDSTGSACGRFPVARHGHAVHGATHVPVDGVRPVHNARAAPSVRQHDGQFVGVLGGAVSNAIFRAVLKLEQGEVHRGARVIHRVVPPGPRLDRPLQEAFRQSPQRGAVGGPRGWGNRTPVSTTRACSRRRARRSFSRAWPISTVSSCSRSSMAA